MYKTISYWTAPQPQDVAAFEEFYQQVHGPMAARVPGVQKLELSRTSDGFAGEPSPFYRVAEMYFSRPGRQWTSPPRPRSGPNSVKTLDTLSSGSRVALVGLDMAPSSKPR